VPATVKDIDKPKGLRLEVYRDGGRQYRWRKVAVNNVNVSVSGEGFKRKSYAISAARREHPNLPLFDLTVGK
jgi:uncharacterized protein YegP (UPF0339 family)